MNTVHSDSDNSIVTKPAARIVLFAFLGIMVALALSFWLLSYIVQGVEVQPELIGSIWRWLVVTGAGWLGYIQLRRVTTIYSVTDKEVFRSAGILSKYQVRIPMQRITNYGGESPWWKRMVGLADVVIESAGEDVAQMRMCSLAIPKAKEIIWKLKERLGRTVDGKDRSSDGT